MNKQKNQVVILLVVIMLGILYTYIQYLFIPQWGVLEQKSAHVTQQKAELRRLEESYQDFSALKVQALDLKAKASELDQKIPKKLDKPEIMLTIYNMAKTYQVSPKNLTYEPIKNEGAYLTMGMNFSCTGSTENIYTLIQQFLVGSHAIFVLDSISLSQAEGVTTANMRIVAYAYQP